MPFFFLSKIVLIEMCQLVIAAFGLPSDRRLQMATFGSPPVQIARIRSCRLSSNGSTSSLFIVSLFNFSTFQLFFSTLKHQSNELLDSADFLLRPQ